MIYVEEIKSKKNGKTYRYRVPYYVNGKRRFKTEAGFKTKKQARQAGLEMEIRLKEGYNPDAENITVADVWEQYWNIHLSMKSKNTQKAYKQVYKLHVAPVFGSKRIMDIHYPDLQLFFNERSHYSWNYLNQLKVVLLGIFKLAVISQYIQNNPMIYVQISSSRKKEPTNDFLSLNQLNDILKRLSMVRTERTDSYVMAVEIGYYSGLRRGEVLGLKWCDIDFQNRTMTVQRQVTEGGLVTDTLKTGSSYATLPLAPALYDLLLEWRKKNPYEVICPDESGNHIHVEALGKVCHDLGFHFHQLRHTFITNVVLNSDPKTAASLARHSNVNTTLNIYTQILESKQKEVMEKSFPVVPDLCLN